MTPAEVLARHLPFIDSFPGDYCSRCSTGTSWPCDAVQMARQLERLGRLVTGEGFDREAYMNDPLYHAVADVWSKSLHYDMGQLPILHLPKL